MSLNSLEVAPSTTPASLVSPIWRCVCVDSNGFVVTNPELCANAELTSPCPVRYRAPAPGAGGEGWRLAHLQFTNGSNGVVHETGGTETAPVLAYEPRSGRGVASSTWRAAAGRATWVWNWDPTSAAPEVIPPIPVTQGRANQATPARVIFWTRAQTPAPPGAPTSNDPETAAQLSQRLQDAYLTAGVPLLTPEQMTLQNMALWRVFNEPHVVLVRPPIVVPPPLPPEHLVSRFQSAIYPVGSASPTWLQAGAFTNPPAGATVTGIVVGQLDLRQGAVTATATTQGASSDLPVYAGASYAVSAPDAYGWSDVAAFGGRDANNALVAELFYTTHTAGANDAPVYTWHRLAPAGSAPAAREGAALSFNGAGKRLYLVGGRNGSTTYDDVRSYDLVTSTWSALTLSGTLPARYDAGLAVRGDVLYIGGGATATGTFLGDLLRVDGLTGELKNFGNALPLGAAPSMSFDEHGDGLVYGGGYVGATWYADVWTVRFEGPQTITSFVRNFGSDGMAATPGYAVVADLYHDMFWGVPGHLPSGTQPEIRFLRDGVATVVKLGDTGSATLAARSAGGGGSADISPARVLRNPRGSGSPTRISASPSGAISRATAPSTPR
ncbi:MAG: kelch repeat-containing protein [Polyangiales bacterium]